MEGHAGAVLALAVARDDQRHRTPSAPRATSPAGAMRWTENVPDSFAG